MDYLLVFLPPCRVPPSHSYQLIAFLSSFALPQSESLPPRPGCGCPSVTSIAAASLHSPGLGHGVDAFSRGLQCRSPEKAWAYRAELTCPPPLILVFACVPLVTPGMFPSRPGRGWRLAHRWARDVVERPACPGHPHPLCCCCLGHR